MTISSSAGSGSNSGQISVTPFNITPDSFVVAQYVNAGPAAATFTAGAGFTLSLGTPVAAGSQDTVGAEYGVLSSSTTGCPMTDSFQGGASQGWGGVCYAFAPSSPDAVTVHVSPVSASGTGTVTVFGTVTAGTGSVANTAVTVTVNNPAGIAVYETTADFTGNAAVANYTMPMTVGGTSSWIGGNYTVIANYATTAEGAPAMATASFSYLSSFVNTAILAVLSPAAQASVGGSNGVQVVYTDTYSQALPAFVWVVARNSVGQDVGVFVGSAATSSGARVTVFVPTSNLPTGSYNATIFATTTSFIAISQASTVSLSVH